MQLGNQRPLPYQPSSQVIPLFGAAPLAPLTWSFNRPQSSDVIEHGNGKQTKITSLIDGGQIFGGIDDLLSRAKRSVLVDMYTLQTPESHPDRISPPGTPGADKQAKIVKKLIELAQSGIKVKVVLDNSVQEDGTRQNDTVIAQLKANGVEVLPYPADAAKINHVKLLVVDGNFAVIGGMNWGNHSAVNHDACVMLEGDGVDNLIHQIYKVDYDFAGGKVSTLPRHQPFPDDKIKVLTTSPKESPDGGQNEIYDEIVAQIDKAKKSIVCQLFVLTDKVITEKLLQAHQRLIKAGKPGVRIMVDPGLYLKFPNCRPQIDYLKAQGVPIQFYEVNWEIEEKLHSKWAVFDEEKLLVGSANWSRTGLASNRPSTNPKFKPFRGNHEANLLVTSRQLCQAFIKQFNYDWANRGWNVGTVGDLVDTIPEKVKEEMFKPRENSKPDNVVSMPQALEKSQRKPLNAFA